MTQNVLANTGCYSSLSRIVEGHHDSIVNHCSHKPKVSKPFYEISGWYETDIPSVQTGPPVSTCLYSRNRCVGTLCECQVSSQVTFLLFWLWFILSPVQDSGYIYIMSSIHQTPMSILILVSKPFTSVDFLESVTHKHWQTLCISLADDMSGL